MSDPIDTYSVTADELRQFIERFEQLDSEKKDLAEQQKELTRWLCTKAVDIGVRRHAGQVTDIYTPTGKKQVVKGKDDTVRTCLVIDS